MTLASSDLTLTAIPVIQTPDLSAAVPRYLAEFGFELQQAVHGVLVVLRLDSLRLHLWRCGVPGGFKPGNHRVAVDDAFALHGRMRSRAGGALSGPPQRKPWGAWEFSLCDADGNLLHMVQWVAAPTAPPHSYADQGRSRAG